MVTKIQASKIATNAGCNVIITNGKCDNPISQLINNVQYGTLFKANKKSQNARKMWISSALQVKGKIFIDEGAEKAVKSGKSILPAGILKLKDLIIKVI